MENVVEVHAKNALHTQNECIMHVLSNEYSSRHVLWKGNVMVENEQSLLSSGPVLKCRTLTDSLRLGRHGRRVAARRTNILVIHVLVLAVA